MTTFRYHAPKLGWHPSRYLRRASPQVLNGERVSQPKPEMTETGCNSPASSTRPSVRPKPALEGMKASPKTTPVRRGSTYGHRILHRTSALADHGVE